jgi:hypothetical protein
MEHVDQRKGRRHLLHLPRRACGAERGIADPSPHGKPMPKSLAAAAPLGSDGRAAWFEGLRR